jgi:Xaa-Pro aminopeptidase
MPLNGERAFQLMQSHKVDTLIASSIENLYYVSDYWSLGKELGCGVQAYALLPMKGDPAIVAPFSEADLVVDSETWIEDIRFHGEPMVEVGQPEEPSGQTESLLELHKTAQPEADGVSCLLKALEEKGLAGGVIALDAAGLTPSMFEHIKGKLSGATIVDGSELLREIRLVKTGPEVERIRRATEITEKSMEDSLEIARAEITELDLAGMFAYSVAYDGGKVTQNLIGFRERSAFPPTLLEAQRRDLVRMTLGCKWGHYHSNISRTAVIGRPLGKATRRWEAVQAAQDAALDAVRPGASFSEVYAAAMKELEAAEVKGFSAHVGHSLGVECNEMPWIGRESEGELLDGMVINIDVPLLELGWGGCQLEDTVLVTSDGNELLTKTERTLYLL